MDDVKRKIISVLALSAIVPIVCVSCVSSGPEPASGIGVGAVLREVQLTGSGLQSTALVVGPYWIPLGGVEFRIRLDPGGEFLPEDFDLVAVSGLGSTWMEGRFVGRGIPLELTVQYGTRLDGPTFEKRLRLRWLGSPEHAPVLEKIVLEELPVGEAPVRSGGPGRPLFLDRVFLASSAPWGGTAHSGGKARIEERPMLSLAGGWWSSRAAVLGPSGMVRPESAYLRWLARRRGEFALKLFARGMESGGELPAFIEGFPVIRLEAADLGRLATAFPAALRERSVPQGAGALRVTGSTGFRPEDPLFRKAMQVLAARGPLAGPVLLCGLDPAGESFALADALALLRASSPGREILVAWGPGEPPAPLWQLELTGQDPLESGAGTPFLGQAGALLTAWWEQGAAWGPEPADRLIGALARGFCRIDLGLLPAEGAPRRFLSEALAWAGRQRELLRSSRATFPEETENVAPGVGWLARREGEVLLLHAGPFEFPLETYLPRGRSWAAMVQIYPFYRNLGVAGWQDAEREVGAGLRLVQAWEEGAAVPAWARAAGPEFVAVERGLLPPERP